MAYQKLTYSGTTVNNYLYFSFEADSFDTAAVTEAMGLVPTTVRLKKQPVPVSTSWTYRIEAGAAVDLETPLARLMDILEDKVNEINYLKESMQLQTYLQFVLHIDIDPDASIPYFGLNKRAINFLSKTGTEVNFDLYKADTTGLLIEK